MACTARNRPKKEASEVQVLLQLNQDLVKLVNMFWLLVVEAVQVEVLLGILVVAVVQVDISQEQHQLLIQHLLL